jgi:4-amino-4-deoxy-L-arabinose transferase-like glycosyltransferase
VLATLAALGAALLFRDYGIGWDTEVQAQYGERVLDYFLSWFKDQRAVTEGGLLPYYGALFELPSAALHRLLGLDKHALRGLLTALCAAGSIPAVAGVARRVRSERTAFASALSLLLFPQLLGQAFINSKDVPLAAAVAWAVLAICRLGTADRIGWRDALLAGVACGAVLAVRVGAVFILVFVAAALLARLAQELHAGRLRPLAWIRIAALRAAAAVAVMWGVTVAVWPYAHANPLANPYLALREATRFPVSYPVLFAGATLDSTHLPAGYLPVYFALTTPLPLLAFLVLGGAVAVVGLVARPWERGSIPALVLLVWLGFPLAYVMIARPNIYDGVRHFLFLLPAMAILAGWGVDSLLSFTEERAGRPATALFFCGVLALTAWPLVRFHPYQYAYLNVLAGPPATVHRRYETDYWVTSYKAAAEWLNQRQASSPVPLHVIAAVNDHSFPALVHFLDSRILWAPSMAVDDRGTLPRDADYYVGTVRMGADRLFASAPVVWEERRGGVLYAVIRSNREK